MEVTEHELIGRIAGDILKKEFTGLVSRNDILSLSTLYRLLNLVEDIEIMRTAWGNYIKVSPISSFLLSSLFLFLFLSLLVIICAVLSPFPPSPLLFFPSCPLYFFQRLMSRTPGQR
jgi:hypothetical protein